MEKIIDTVLERLKETNLHSAVARQTIVKAIMKEIRSGRPFFLNMNTIDTDIPEVGDRLEEAKWVCEHCGESTFYVEYDYIGSGSNHLQCDLKEEEKMGSGIKHFADDFHEGRDGDIKDIQQQAYNELTADGLPTGGDSQAVLDSHKLAQDIAEGSVDLGYIFESPDGGKTIFKRKSGETEREEVTEEQWKEYNRNR